MKKRILNQILGMFVFMLMSCSEISFGDDFLGNRPESSGADVEKMFSNKTEAEKVLTEAYRNLPYGIHISFAGYDNFGHHYHWRSVI